MSDTKHTPEPWSLEEVGDKVKHLCPAHDGVSILTVAIEYQDGEDEATHLAAVWSREDARRIVACVNACAGMADPEKEIATLRAELATPILVATNRLADALADERAKNALLEQQLFNARQAVLSEGIRGDSFRAAAEMAAKAIAHIVVHTEHFGGEPCTVCQVADSALAALEEVLNG